MKKESRILKNLRINYLKLLMILGFIALINIGCDDNTPSKEFSYSDLAHKLTDLEALAILPEPGEKTAMWSSYDRRSRYDERSDTYKNWGGDKDHLGYIRKEGEYLVFAEMEGPGCIWRIWSAKADEGHDENISFEEAVKGQNRGWAFWPKRTFGGGFMKPCHR